MNEYKFIFMLCGARINAPVGYVAKLHVCLFSRKLTLLLHEMCFV